jgi:RNA polymerase sigma factor (sigma-70 family)
MTGSAAEVEELLRRLTPVVLAALVARHGQFEACEDAVQEALADAAVQWPRDGVPDNPRGWLATVARRALVDAWRSDAARRRREHDAAVRDLTGAGPVAPGVGSRAAGAVSEADDTLLLLFLCCHPALTVPSQLALTLRAVAGLSTAQIASAFHVPEPTMSQRIRRAKQEVRAAGARFEPPTLAELPSRLAVVLQVIYLLFNEGYTATSGAALDRPDLADEALRVARLLRRLRPDDAEVAGLLALMLLVHARRAARLAPDGSLIPLDEQDRTLWDQGLVREGLDLLHAVLGRGPIGPIRCRPRSPPSTTRPRRRIPPTGRRSSPSTRCSNASPPARWSPSAGPSPWPMSTDPSPDWR